MPGLVSASLLNVPLWHDSLSLHACWQDGLISDACPTCLQEVLGQLRKETAKVGKGGDELVFAYVTALTAGLINRSCYDEEAWKEVGSELIVCYVWHNQLFDVSSVRPSRICALLPIQNASITTLQPCLALHRLIYQAS